MATENKVFTEGFYEGHKDLGSPRKHNFRDETPEKHISNSKFTNFPLKTKSFIKRATSSVAWEETSMSSMKKSKL